MRLLGRPDAPFLVALTAALVIIILGRASRLFIVIGELEAQVGFPFLLVLVLVSTGYLFTRQRKQHDTELQSAVAEISKREAGRRTSEIQRLVSFGQAVARALDHESMRAAINQHLPRVAGTPHVWVLIRQGPRWELLAGTPDDKKALEREEFAERILSGERAGVIRDARAGFPMVVGGTAVGVLCIEQAGHIEEDRERLIEATASLIAISLKNVELFHDVRETGVRDGLTGCWTRTHAIEVIDSELRRARRSRLPVSIILFDLDHFKSINDRFGHLCGDAVLAEVGRRFHQVLRTSDLKCRYGGEEFLGVLPATPLHGAGCVAETLRRELADRPIRWENEMLTVTASIGVTQAEPGEIDIDAIIGRADAALYRAKQQGRNRVRLEPDAPPVMSEGRKTEAPA